MNIGILQTVQEARPVFAGISLILNRLSECFTAPWLLAAPKQRRVLKDIRRRHAGQIREFIRKNRVERFEKCDTCGSPKLPDHACLICFEYIRNKVNKEVKY